MLFNNNLLHILIKIKYEMLIQIESEYNPENANAECKME